MLRLVQTGWPVGWRARVRRLLARATTDFDVERERWFLWVPPVFALGIAAYFKLLFEPGLATALLPLAGLLLMTWMLRRSPWIVVVQISAIAAAGFAAAKLRTETVRAPVLVQSLRAAEVEGVVEQIERRANGSQRVTMRVRQISGLPAEWTPRRIRIRLGKTAPGFELGQMIIVRARLAPPPPPVIPRGYDFARAAYFQGIGAVGYALSPPKLAPVQVASSGLDAVWLWLQELRADIGRKIEAALPGETGVIANALMTGERSGISEETSDLYRDAGIFHILSISGLHMAIMGGSVFALVRFTLAAFPAIALRFPIKKWAAVAATLATFGYLLISGGAYPTIRSFIMITVMFFAIFLDRPAIALRNVALAALLILVALPESLFNVGFQLSFAAVIALVAAYEAHRARTQRRRRLGLIMPPATGLLRWLSLVWALLIGAIATTVIAGTATAPFAAFHFHTAQVYSVLTNMLAIPVSNLIVMPAALAAFVMMPLGLEALPLAVMGWGVDVMTWSAREVSSLTGAVVAIPSFSETALHLMIFGGLWLLLWRRAWRWCGLVLFIAGLWLATDARRPAVLISRDAAVVAVRGPDGGLSARRARRGAFELGRWLEHDGDTRQPKQAWHQRGRSSPFRCDLDGCTVRVGGRTLAIPRSYAALVDDCRRADVLVMTFRKPAGCRTPRHVVDFLSLKRTGAQAIYLTGDGLRFETVESVRGHRPWTVAARLEAQAAFWRYRRLSRKTVKRREEADGKGEFDGTREKKVQPREFRPEIEDGHPLYWYN